MTRTLYCGRTALWLGALLLLLWLGKPALAAAETPDTVKPPPQLAYLVKIYFDGPLVPPAACPLTSNNSYSAIPIEGAPRHSPYTPAQDPDLNLAVRGYVTAAAHLGLINLDGDTDTDAPQLAHLFRPARVPTLHAAHRVYDWDWACSTHGPGLGCRGEPLSKWEVTLLSMATTPGEAIYPPARNADVLAGYVAMVLYAEERRVTFVYTRRDTPALGYVVHLEDFCVDPNLLARYRSTDEAGRQTLVGLRRDDPLGTAAGDVIRVAIRDTGEFMDPRSAKDWWQAVVRARRESTPESNADSR